MLILAVFGKGFLPIHIHLKLASASHCCLPQTLAPFHHLQ